MPRRPRRRRPCEQGGERGEDRRLEHGGPGRPREQRALVQVLQQLGVNLAARHAFADRRGVDLAQAQTRHGEQHQLLPQPVRLHASVEHVGGADEALGVAQREVRTQRAVAIRGHQDPADRDALHRRAGHDQAQRRSPGGHAEHLDRERGKQRTVEIRDRRHRADHAVDGVRRNQPPARRRFVDRLHADQRPGVTHDPRGVEAGRRGRGNRLLNGERRRAQRPAGGLGHAGHGQHRRCRGHGAGKQRVVRGQTGPRQGGSAQARSGPLEQALRGQRVRFGHEDVDAQHRGPMTADPGNEIGEQRARPGPAAEGGEAPAVDLDHDRGHRPGPTREGRLAGVEPRLAQRCREPRALPDQQRQDDDQRRTDGPAATSPRPRRCGRGGGRQSRISRPSYAAQTCSGLPRRVISSSRRVSASIAASAVSSEAGS